MLTIRLRAAITTLVLLIGLTQALGARDRQASLGSPLALQPGADGVYTLPSPEGEPLPLSFHPGETGLDLQGLSFDLATRTLSATLRHRGEGALSALAVELTLVSGPDQPSAVLTLTEDWSAAAQGGALRRFRASGLSRPVHERGLFFPGQTHRIELGVPLPAAPGAPSPTRVELSVPLVVFDDASFSGSVPLARQILGARKVAVEELSYWEARLETAVREAGSDGEALEAARTLLRDLEEGAEDLPHSAQAVRAGLRYELEPALSAAAAGEGPGPGRDELRSLREWVRLEVEAWSRHVPRELPREPPPAAAGGARLEERFHDGGDDGDTDSDDMNCDCGGSMSTSVAQTESRVCNGSATGWRVDETWSYTCRAEDGAAIGSGTGSLRGYGGCIEGIICFPNTYCPPFFGPPSESEDFDYRIWNRTVTNYVLLVGTCTARCSLDGSLSLTFKCLCSPRRQPGCTIDGCPILIETGAGGFQLTDLDGGVRFDIDGDGLDERVSWPVTDTDDAWLALDRNGNGMIDDGTELFGDATAQSFSDAPNGFRALAVFDHASEGGDSDGWITAADAVWPRLRLWLDRDHDGVSSPSELSTLDEVGISAIELDYHESHRRDRYGNQFRYAARVWYASGARRLAADVFLLVGSD